MHLQVEADEKVCIMLDAGIVEPSISDFSPPVLVRKKDGSIRCYVDYCKLNKATIKDSYIFLSINEEIDSIGRDAKYFITLDLAICYDDAEEDKAKTAFPSRYGLLQLHGHAVWPH